MRKQNRILAAFFAAALLFCAVSCRTVQEPEGHNMGVWTAKETPTYRQNGTMERKCLDENCSYTETIRLKASRGLAYTEKDGETFVSGKGNCRDSFLYIASETPEGAPVRGVSLGAFTDDFSVRYLYIEDGVQILEGYAFSGCGNLLSARLPQTADEPGAGAFLSCSSLREISLPRNLKVLPESFFDGCEALRSADLPDGLEVLSHSAFNLCKSLESIALPETLRVIGSNCFDSCASLQGLAFPETLQEIGSYAFAGCDRIRTLIIASPLTILGECAFSGSGRLRQVYIDGGVRTLNAQNGISPFFGCDPDLVIYTNAPERPERWSELFNVCSATKDAGGQTTYVSLKVVYNSDPETLAGSSGGQ